MYNQDIMRRLLVNKFISFVVLIIFLSGCKINFIGDLYTSDLLELAHSVDNKSFNLPMEIEYQVSACEDTDEVNRIISTYFISYKNTGCSVGDDFMSYAKAQVTVPVVNKYEVLNDFNNSLIGFVSYLSEDGTYVYVDASINAVLYESLQNYVYNETYQELSLTESNLIIRLNNDLNSATVEVQASFVNNEPIVFPTEYVLARRELLIIQSSNVATSFLEDNLWTPLFLIYNTYEN